MRHLEKIRDMLCDELDQIAEKGELTAGNLETVDKLTHSIKSVDTIMAMQDAGYSERSYPRYSYARRDSMGRYSRGEDHVVMELREAMEATRDPAMRDEIKRLIDKAERM